MNQPKFGVIGGGWRAEFYLRIARDLPEAFPLAGVAVRDPGKGAALAARWRIPVFASAEELLSSGKPDFVVTSVPWAANQPLLERLAARGVPVLSETPIAPQLGELREVFQLAEKGARIQIAEQYLFQPFHAARLEWVRSGKIGEVREATVSVAHGYHGMSLLRHYLGTGLRLPKVAAFQFCSPLTAGPDRSGPPLKHELKESRRVIARLDYGDKLGIYDFTGDQYFSWIRGHHLLLRGEKGEINGDRARYLLDFRTPMRTGFVRRDTGHGGNLEGHSLDCIQAGGAVCYRNPFCGARWSDDEIAVATSLAKMQRYVREGEEFYPVADACQDRYLDLLVEEAVSSGEIITASRQPWTPGG